MVGANRIRTPGGNRRAPDTTEALNNAMTLALKAQHFARFGTRLRGIDPNHHKGRERLTLFMRLSVIHKSLILLKSKIQDKGDNLEFVALHKNALIR
ncbi:hypothetical protein [Halomonas sp. 707B3]|uniref:hypothetical protein n=1 Tax=Halomonas sp. 707B3 TaxID=1681043 RepID=UPI00209EE827|nr:hypothetical protein [Halomonas sp. 707B3]MCP1317837.1 hypothetical protein [Halomonas sp. 707B3]